MSGPPGERAPRRPRAPRPEGASPPVPGRPAPPSPSRRTTTRAADGCGGSRGGEARAAHAPSRANLLRIDTDCRGLTRNMTDGVFLAESAAAHFWRRFDRGATGADGVVAENCAGGTAGLRELFTMTVDDDCAPRHRAAFFLLLLALLIRGPSYSAASDVDDTCSPTKVCTRDQLTGVALFCDYAIGPEAGGRCQMCGDENPLTFCSVFKPELAVFGSKDCIERCAFRNCVESCPDGDFCSHYNLGAQSSCQNCQALIVHPDECKSGDFRFPTEGVAACEQTCPAKTCTKARHCLITHPSTKFFCNLEDAEEGEEAQGTCAPCAGLAALEDCEASGTSALGRQECEAICAQTIVTSCAAVGNAACADLPTSHFCGDGGVCRECPTSGLDDFHPEDCFSPDPNFQGNFGLTTNGTAQSCADLCHTDCYENRTAIVEVMGLDIEWDEKNNFPMLNTPHKDATGPLVDCGMGGVGECQTSETEGFMCLISRGARKFSDKVLNCEEAGGVGAVMYNNQAGARFVQGGVGDVPMEISMTSITMEDGLYLLELGLEMELRLHVQYLGDICKTGCSDRLACPLEGTYCEYEPKNGTQGYCHAIASSGAVLGGSQIHPLWLVLVFSFRIYFF